MKRHVAISDARRGRAVSTRCIDSTRRKARDSSSRLAAAAFILAGVLVVTGGVAGAARGAHGSTVANSTPVGDGHAAGGAGLSTDGNGIVELSWNGGHTQTFSYSGAVQTFVVPADVTIMQASATGGSGGNSSDAVGGTGATESGLILVKPAETLYVYVGGRGQDASDSPCGANSEANASGGFNGGGAGGYGSWGASSGAGGGGMSDVQTLLQSGGTASTVSSWLIGAGGGGGAGGPGRISCADVTAGGSGGTDTAGAPGNYQYLSSLPGLGGGFPPASGGGGLGGAIGQSPNGTDGTPGNNGYSGTGVQGGWEAYDPTYSPNLGGDLGGGAGGGGGGGYEGGGGGGSGALYECSPSNPNNDDRQCGVIAPGQDAGGGGGGGAGSSYLACGATQSNQTASEDRAPVGTSGCPTAPILSLSATNPTLVHATGTTPFSLDATITTRAAITDAAIEVALSPSVVVPKTKTLKATVGSVDAVMSKKVTVSGGELVPTVIGNGDTLAGMDVWAAANNNWHNEAMPKPTFSGGRLVYSDYPEYLASSTQIGKGVGVGANVEGILYKEGAGADAAGPGPVLSHQFRVFFNHENRTGVAKTICVVFSASLAGDSVTELRHGVYSLNTSDPVAAGRSAIAAYLASQSGKTLNISTKVGKTTIPVVADCPANAVLGTASGAVATGIIDYTMTGRGYVQVGLVVLDTGKDVTAFVNNPLGYHFPTHAKTPYTYASGPALYNPTEPVGHVSGTFPHDNVATAIEPCNPACSPYKSDDGNLWGAEILGNPANGTPEDGAEYEKSVDTGKYDIGGYGMEYDLTVPTVAAKGVSNEADQVLFNDRGVGPQKGYTNGFADVVVANGTEISAPAIGQPGVGKSGNLIEKDYGIGVGQVKAGSTFALKLIPSAGSAFPIGIVLAPAFLKLEGTLTYDSGSKVKSTPLVTIVKLAPTGGQDVVTAEMLPVTRLGQRVSGGRSFGPRTRAALGLGAASSSSRRLRSTAGRRSRVRR